MRPIGLGQEMRIMWKSKDLLNFSDYVCSRVLCEHSLLVAKSWRHEQPISVKELTASRWGEAVQLRADATSRFIRHLPSNSFIDYQSKAKIIGTNSNYDSMAGGSRGDVHYNSQADMMVFIVIRFWFESNREISIWVSSVCFWDVHTGCHLD